MKKYVSLIFLCLCNSLLLSIILGFIWYIFGGIDFLLTDTSGVEVIIPVIIKAKILFFIILFILEYLSVILFKKQFSTKKTIIIYFIIATFISIWLWILSSIGFPAGTSINNDLKITYKLIACLGLRYKLSIFTLNIPTLFALIYINYKKKNL